MPHGIGGRGPAGGFGVLGSGLGPWRGFGVLGGLGVRFGFLGWF